MILVTKDAFDAMRLGEKYRFTAHIESNLDVRIFLTPKENEDIHVWAYLMSRIPNQRIEKVNEVSCMVHSLDTLSIDVRDLCNKLIRQLNVLRNPQAKTRKVSTKDFAARVLAVSNIMDPKNFAPFVRRGWGVSTAESAVKYFANTIGNVYANYGADASVEDFMGFLDSEISRIYDAEFKHPTSDGHIIKQRREEIYNGLMNRWGQAWAVQQFLLKNHPEGGWPETPIPVLARYKTPSTEEIKAIQCEHYVEVLRHEIVMDIAFADDFDFGF